MTPKPLKILLADDEEIVHQTLSGYLRDAGQQVDDVRDGMSALQAIKSSAYDLALIDLVMPGMEGLAVLREAVKIRPEMPAVVITGHPDLETAVTALRLGAADYLGKPVKLSELDEVLHKARHLRTLRSGRGHVSKAARRIPPPANPRTEPGELVGAALPPALSAARSARLWRGAARWCCSRARRERARRSPHGRSISRPPRPTIPSWP